MSNVRNFGATGDGRTDDADAILHTLGKSDGVLEFPVGTYRISKTIEINLAETGFCSIDGILGTSKIVMAGPGPAFRIVGTHAGTAAPSSMKPGIWKSERFPNITGLSIEGDHPEADGIELVGTVQAIVQNVHIRRTRNAIRLHKRNRNVLVNACQIYDNTGVGIFIEACNLHQINITGNHVSYCRLGGIRIENSEVRNLQITGNDIEYNNHKSHKTEPEPTADIWIDSSAKGASVREVTISSNTVQATYSPGGCNIRIIGGLDSNNQSAGMWTISGNVIGSQENGVHLTRCRDIVLSGNFIYSSQHRNILVEESRSIVIGANVFGHNPDYRNNELATGIRLENCRHCNLNGFTIQDATAGRHTVPGIPPQKRTGLIELADCKHIHVSNCQILDGTPHGVDVTDSSLVRITENTIAETRPKTKRKSTAPIRWRGKGSGNVVSGNSLGGKSILPAESGVDTRDNVEI